MTDWKINDWRRFSDMTTVHEREVSKGTLDAGYVSAKKVVEWVSLTVVAILFVSIFVKIIQHFGG